MKTQLLTALALLTATLASPGIARACGGVTESSRMCVAVPTTVSTFLQDDRAMALIADQGHIEFLTTDESSVMVAVSKNRLVSGSVVGKSVSDVGVRKYRNLYSGWFVRIGEYPGLVKLLTSLQFRGLLAKLRAEGARISSLYAMSDGSGLVRINGTDANAHSVRGVMSPTGELSGLEIRP